MSYQYDANGNLIPQGGQPAQPTPVGASPAYQQTQQVPAVDLNNVPEYLRRGQDEDKGALNAGGGVGGPRLSIRGKQFRFIEGEEERAYPFGQPLHVIILTTDPKEGLAKNFYEGSYQEGSDQIPVCYSSDGHTPDAGSEKVQAQYCADCPHNKFGTAIQQDGTLGKGKACRDFKRVYVVPYDQPFSEVYEMRVPPTSFPAMKAYGAKLDRAGIKLHGVITTLNFADSTSPELTFTLAGYLDEQVVRALDEKIHSGELDAVRPSLLKSPATFHGQQALPQGGQPNAQQQLPPAGNNPQVASPQPEPVQQSAPQTAPVGAQPQPTQAVQGGAVPPPPGAPAQGQSAPAAPAPCPLGAPQGFRMTEKAGATPYQSFTKAGWSDKQLVDNGMMVQV